MQSPPFLRYLVPHRSKYSPQHHVFKHPQLHFLPQWSWGCLRFVITPDIILIRITNFSGRFLDEIENQNLCSPNYFRPSWCLWNNPDIIVRPDWLTDDNITWCMHFACPISNATITLRIYNNFCFLTVTIVNEIHLTITLNLHYISCQTQQQIAGE